MPGMICLMIWLDDAVDDLAACFVGRFVCMAPWMITYFRESMNEPWFTHPVKMNRGLLIPVNEPWPTSQSKIYSPNDTQAKYTEQSATHVPLRSTGTPGSGIVSEGTERSKSSQDLLPGVHRAVRGRAVLPG